MYHTTEFKGFHEIFFIEKIMEIRRLSGPVTEASKCDVCSGDEESAVSSTDVSVAAMYCTNCRYNLCTRCTNDHIRHMKKHCIVELGCGKVTEQLAKTLKTGYCNSHPEDVVRMFCLDCKVVICFVCFAEKHQMHKCSDINKEAEIMRKQIESDIKGVSSFLLAFQQGTAEMDDKKNNFLKQVETVEKDICLRSNQLKQIIDRDTKTLLNELESMKSSELKDMYMKTEELDRCGTILNSFKAYGEEIVAHGSANDVCHCYNQFHDRYDEIVENFKEPPFKQFSPKRVALQTISVNDVQQKNLIGRLEDISCKNDDDSNSLNILLSINFRDELGRLKLMCMGSRDIQKWKDFPFEFKQMPEVDEKLFLLSIYTVIDDFTMAQFRVPDGIGIGNLADVITGSVTTDKMLMIVFERGERVVKLIGSQAHVAETKRSIESMAGKNLISDLLPEIDCKVAIDTYDRGIAKAGETKIAIDTYDRGIAKAGETKIAIDTYDRGIAKAGETKIAKDAGKTKMAKDGVKITMAKDAGKTEIAKAAGKIKMAKDGVNITMAKDVGKTEMAKAAGKIKMAKDGVNVTMAKDAGNTEMAKAAGKIKMAKVSGKTKMAKDAGKTKMAKDAGKTEMAKEADGWVTDETADDD